MNLIKKSDVLRLPCMAINPISIATFPAINCIYFVVNRDILYIGRTGNLRRRWVRHHRLDQAFDHNANIHWLEFDAGLDISAIEERLIKHFFPPWNSQSEFSFGRINRSPRKSCKKRLAPKQNTHPLPDDIQSDDKLSFRFELWFDRMGITTKEAAAMLRVSSDRIRYWKKHDVPYLVKLACLALYHYPKLDAPMDSVFDDTHLK